MRDMVELSNVEAYKPNAAVTAAMEKQLQRDPAKEAEAAAGGHDHRLRRHRHCGPVPPGQGV